VSAVVATKIDAPVNGAPACTDSFEQNLIAILQPTGGVARLDNWRWSIATPDGITIRVARDDNWLHFSTAVDGRCSASKYSDWRLLESNASLPAGIRFAVDQQCSLRADLPVDGHLRNGVAHLTAGVNRIVDGFMQTLSGDWVDSGESVAPICPAGEIGHFCTAAGWTSTTRTDDGLGVELDVHNGYHSAELVQSRAGGWCLRARLGIFESDKPVQRRALALCLLRASDVVCLARPFADTEGAVGYEAPLDESPGETQIRHALSSLSVACQQVGREISALLDHETLAEAYLGIALGPRNREQPPLSHEESTDE